MVWEHDHRIDSKGMFFGNVSKRLAQEVTGHGFAKHRAAVGGDDGEEIGRPRDESAAITHGEMSDYAYG